MNYYVDGDERVKRRKYSIKVLSEKKRAPEQNKGGGNGRKGRKRDDKIKIVQKMSFKPATVTRYISDSKVQ